MDSRKQIPAVSCSLNRVIISQGKPRLRNQSLFLRTGIMNDMNNSQLANLLGTSSFTVTPTDLGVSNRNSLVTAGNEEYFWRRPVPGKASLKTDRKAEAAAMKLAAAAGLDVPTLYFDGQTGEKLTRRVDALPFDASQASNRYRRTGQLLSRLHTLEPIPALFDPFEKLEQYRSQTRTPIHFPHEQAILETARGLWQPACLCHNDLVPGNILLGPDRDWLIDYEYAATGDPRFDLASFLSENDITEPACRRQFLEGYGKPVPEWQVMIFELVADMIWANWAQMLLEDRQDPVFAAILRDKQAHFEKILDKLVDRKK